MSEIGAKFPRAEELNWMTESAEIEQEHVREKWRRQAWMSFTNLLFQLNTPGHADDLDVTQMELRFSVDNAIKLSQNIIYSYPIKNN